MKECLHAFLELMMTTLLYDCPAVIIENRQRTQFDTGEVGLVQHVGSSSIYLEVSALLSEKGGPWEILLLDRSFIPAREGTLILGEHRIVAVSCDRDATLEIDIRPRN